jgi:hypothetical protein
MKFKLSVRLPGQRENWGVDWLDLDGLRGELTALGNVADALVIGETVTVERIE